MTKEEIVDGLYMIKNWKCNGDTKMHEVVTDAIKALEKESKWIPVSERLPEDLEVILFSTKTDGVFEGRYFSDDTDIQWYSFRDETFVRNNVVSAWMPLPASYE